MTEHVTVIGSGSWGTALAIQYARAGTQVRLWGRDAELLDSMHANRVNERYLPGAPFPYNLFIVKEWSAALDGVSNVLVSIPSHAFRNILERLASEISDPASLNLCWATKGLEISTGLLPHQVVKQVLPGCGQFAVLSGPTFASEVGKGLPTAITVAASSDSYANAISQQITSPEFRVYTSSDIIGVEVGGAVKNVLAIGAGLSDGLGFGANARVALINRGLIEMSRLGVAMGAKSETFMGLAGMGDLVLTCTDNQSRNRRMGLALASGKNIKEAEEEIQQVVEGVAAAKAVHAQAQKLGVDLPIIEQIYRVVIEGVDPRDAVQALLSRNTGNEV